jgi:hypothetical protein
MLTSTHQHIHSTHSVIVTRARLKSPIGGGVEGSQIVFDEELLILFGVDRAYRSIDDRDLALQGIVMTRLERLRQAKHGRDVDDVV